jgi:Domain of unknown function (DUF5060)/Putative collagen-binding domain of a collagenase
MRAIAGVLLAILTAAAASEGQGATLPSCDTGTTKYSPCELRFEWNEGEIAGAKSPFRDDLLHIEFRGPDQKTFLIASFWDAGRTLRVRFTPNQSGNWTYRITSDIKRYDRHEATFAVGDSQSPGFVSVANMRHWWTDNKQPHLWSSVEVPWLDLDEAAFRQFAAERKREGFTHLRGVLLRTGSKAGEPLLANSMPNSAYFDALDDRLLDAHGMGFVLDLILADESFVQRPAFQDWQERSALIRYLMSRYAPLNVTWQGLAHFEDRPGNRDLLKELGSLIQKYDSFRHSRSTDAQMSSSVLLRDGWENFIVESSRDPQLAAVERQFTAAPQIHVIQTAEPDALRRELWNSTANGEYPTIRYEAMRNPSNLETMKIWIQVMSDVRHWEFEPYFDVDGARGVGLDNVEYLLYAERPGTVEIAFTEKHKYNPQWVNPRTGETIALKDVKQDTYTQPTPQSGNDWIFQVPREGRKEGMLKSYKFESVPAPVQEVEVNPTKIPFEIVQPSGDKLDASKTAGFQVRVTRPNRATRLMQYVWYGEVVAGGEGARVIGLGASGKFVIPSYLVQSRPVLLNVRLSAINSNGKAYSLEKVYPIE